MEFRDSGLPDNKIIEDAFNHTHTMFMVTAKNSGNCDKRAKPAPIVSEQARVRRGNVSIHRLV